MKYIFILEDDTIIKKDLQDTIKSIDPQIQVRFFENLAEFHEWMKVAMAKGPLSLASGDTPANADDTLKLIISKNEFLGTHNLELIRRSLDFLLRKKICTAESPTSIVLTAFDSPDFQILDAENPMIANVLFKPFDKLILKQHLEYALNGHQKLDGATISTIEVSDKVEMLKRGNYHTISEIGFSTISNMEIPAGTVTKYYADMFTADSKKSIFAFCTSSIKKGPEEFANEFQFFAAESAQIVKIRTHIAQSTQAESTPVFKKAGQPFNIVIINDNAQQQHELKALLQDKFSRVTLHVYASPEQFRSDIANVPANINCIFASYDFFEIDKAKKWDVLVAAIREEVKKRGGTAEKDPDLFILAKKKIESDNLKELSLFAKDIYFFPLDRIYITKKFSAFYDTLALQKSLSISHLKDPGKMKIANFAAIKQISEAGLVMNYHRCIEIGSFREFVLLRSSELESPEITGVSNFSEEQSDGKDKVASNHFVFFGMRDHYLKHIRLWIRDTYIRNKGEEN